MRLKPSTTTPAPHRHSYICPRHRTTQIILTSLQGTCSPPQLQAPEPTTTPQKSLIETGPVSIGPRMTVVNGGSAETETIHDLFPHVELYAANLICKTETIHDLVPHVERYAANLICSIYCNGAFSCILTRFNVRPVLSAESRHCAIHCQYGAPSFLFSCWASLTAECAHTSSCRLSTSSECQS